jgi:hypothetical protein
MVERHFTIQRGATNLGITSGLAQGRSNASEGFSMNVNIKFFRFTINNFMQQLIKCI